MRFGRILCRNIENQLNLFCLYNPKKQESEKSKKIVRRNSILSIFITST